MLVSLADVAVRAGVTRPAVSNWRRRYPDFPRPTLETGTTTLFRLSEIEAWATRHQKPLVELSTDQAVWTALNPARGTVLPENAAEAGMAALGWVVASTRLGDGVDDVLKSLGDSRPTALRELLYTLARRVESAGLPHLVADHLWRHGGGEDYADFLQDVARLALRHGPADVFEALLAASARGSRGAGEHATPGVIARLLTALSPAQGTVLDFACGQGTLLLSAAQSAGTGQEVTLIGQDIDDGARRLAQVRLLVHGHSAELVTGDTLHGKNQYRSAADLVMADPPFAHRWAPDRRMSPVDLPFGVPPRTKADLAWVQYAIGALRPGGRALVVTSMGPLFRGGAEAEIRRRLVQAGCVEAVVGLPPGLYPHTSIPVSVLVLSAPEHGSPRDVVLVDASEMGTRLRGRTELSESDIAQISAAAQRGAGKTDVPATAVAVDSLTAGDCSLAPARWTASETDPQRLVDRVENATRRLREASERLAQIEPLPLAVAADGPQTRSTSLLTMAVVLVRPSRVDAADLGVGDVGVIRAGDIVANSPVVPSACIERDKLPHPPELTRPGDVLVLTDGRVRAGVDRRGGCAVAGPIQVVRPNSDVISPQVLAALITYFGSRQAVGVTVPRVNLKSVEIPVLDVDSMRSLDAALRMLGEHQHWTTIARGALDDLSDALVAGVSSGSLALEDDMGGGRQ